MPQLPEIKVDFNNSQADGFLFARSQRASAPVSRGDWVLAADFEGNECRAQVVRVDDDLVYLKPDLESWKSGDDMESPSTAAQDSLTAYYSFAYAKKRRLVTRKTRTSQVTGASGQLVGVA